MVCQARLLHVHVHGCLGDAEAVRRLASREPPMLPCNACYGFAETEAATDSGAYNTIKRVRGSLRPPQTRRWMQALPLQNFSPVLVPGSGPCTCSWPSLFYSISTPNKSEAPTLPCLTQTGEDSASDWSGAVFRGSHAVHAAHVRHGFFMFYLLVRLCVSVAS